MRTSQGSSQSIGRRVAQVAVLGLLAMGSVGLTATTPAFASGTSDTKFNCYTQWWNTAWAQKCPSGATWTGVYTSGVVCSSQTDKSMAVVRVQGSNTVESGDDCSHSASDGWISYSPY